MYVYNWKQTFSVKLVSLGLPDSLFCTDPKNNKKNISKLQNNMIIGLFQLEDVNWKMEIMVRKD